jgi:glycosyltransferase involved in cell wall biosynthesis
MFGNEFIEAAPVGTAAIVSERTAMAENARRLRAGRMVTREDAPAWAAAIREVVNHLITLSQRIERCKEAAGCIGPEAVARAHRKLYKEMLGVG